MQITFRHPLKSNARSIGALDLPWPTYDTRRGKDGIVTDLIAQSSSLLIWRCRLKLLVAYFCVAVGLTRVLLLRNFEFQLLLLCYRLC